MKKIIATCILITFAFSLQGAIENVQVAQRTDGSGIVDISYELLPDNTFPSFEVSAYTVSDGPVIYWVENEPGNEWSVYANTGNHSWMDILMIFPCYNNITNVTFSNSVLALEFSTGWPDSSIFIYSIAGSNEVIPAGFSDFHLFNINTDFGFEGLVNCEPTIDVVNEVGWDILVDWRPFDQVGDIMSPIFPQGEGVGENILPGLHSLTWQAPSNFYSNNMVIRIEAYAHIVDSELPFDMATIPSGTYYDTNSELQTMDYAYEIMKYELTNEEIVTWVLTEGEEIECYEYNNQANFTFEEIQNTIAYTFTHINFDGNVLEIEPGYGTFPAVFEDISTFNYDSIQFLFGCFMDYYGLRVPTQDEWLYAARGSADIPFPWFEGEWQCEDSEYLEETCTDFASLEYGYCAVICYYDQMCSDGQPLFEICGEYDNNSCLYPGGQYNNASPFGVYDMIGNAAEIITTEYGYYSVGELQYVLGYTLGLSGGDANTSVCEIPEGFMNEGDYTSWFSQCGYDANLIVGDDSSNCMGYSYFDFSNFEILPHGVRLVRTVIE